MKLRHLSWTQWKAIPEWKRGQIAEYIVEQGRKPIREKRTLVLVFEAGHDLPVVMDWRAYVNEPGRDTWEHRAYLLEPTQIVENWYLKRALGYHPHGGGWVRNGAGRLVRGLQGWDAVADHHLSLAASRPLYSTLYRYLKTLSTEERIDE